MNLVLRGVTADAEIWLRENDLEFLELYSICYCAAGKVTNTVFQQRAA